MEKPRLQKLKRNALIALLAIVPATTSGILSYIESRSVAREQARGSTETTLTSVTPAITELQKIVTNMQTDHAAIITESNKLRAAVLSMSKDVQYCKAYVMFDSRGRYKPNGSLVTPAAVARLEESPGPHPHTLDKPKAQIPDTAKKAEQYKDARTFLKCEPGDPLCGSSALK